MTDIDASADIELTAANEHVMARIPLAGQVTGEWLGCYHRLARAAAVPARAETQPDRAWTVVTVPAASSHAEIAETLDAARALIAAADTVAWRAPPTAQAEASIRLVVPSAEDSSGDRGTVAGGDLHRGAPLGRSPRGGRPRVVVRWY